MTDIVKREALTINALMQKPPRGRIGGIVGASVKFFDTVLRATNQLCRIQP
jgi:hypothetical protein